MIRRSVKRVLWFLTALALGAALLQAPVFTYFRHQAWDIWVAQVASFFRIGMLSVPSDVQKQLETLRAENVRLAAETADYRHLRQQLGSPAFSDFRAIPAEIVGRPIDTFHAQVILNRGTHDGVTLGAPVIVNGSVLVGFITDLSEQTATVQLLVHPDAILAAEAVDPERPGRGLVQGRFFTAAILKTVPRDISLHERQPVVTQAKAGILPYGLLIGYIQNIILEEHEPYQTARLALPYRLDTLRAVHVLVPP
jgi:rod shape-determining protein MreC